MVQNKNADALPVIKKELIKNKAKISDNAKTVLERRYLAKDDKNKLCETPEELFARVAINISLADQNYDSDADIKESAKKFYDLMAACDFLPNSPTLMNAGRHLQQLSACFVLPIDDDMGSIMQTLYDTVMVHKSGGGTGFSFNKLRPNGARIKTTNGTSPGPVSFIRMYNNTTEEVKQGGTRRGANMGILRIDHPDIIDFIYAKTDNQAMTNFNLSVALTDKFMEAVQKKQYYHLVNSHNKKNYNLEQLELVQQQIHKDVASLRLSSDNKKVFDRHTDEEIGVVREGDVLLNAEKVFDLIVKMAWKNGEPGTIFIDRMNEYNPTPNVGEFESTNPCGEQPLLPYESCNLGSINLANFVNKGEIDYDRLKQVVHDAVHFLDNVIDMNKYPLKQISKMTLANRKIGLGVMGFADLLIKMKIPYNSDKGTKLGEKIMKFIDDESKNASVELAKKRGTFPNFKDSVYDKDSKNFKGKDLLLRNATTTTIAPTGSISIIAGASSGVEPLFAIAFKRMNILHKGDVLIDINPLFEKQAKDMKFYSKELMEKVCEQGTIHKIDDIPKEVRNYFVTSHDISPEYHIKMQAAFQNNIDNAVSKTVNFSNKATEADIKNVYEMAFKTGCKGVTVYRDGSRDEQVLNIMKKEKEVEQPPKRAAAVKKKRPVVTVGATRKIKTGCGNLYVTINQDESGELFEVFNQIGKAGGCADSQAEAIGRLSSLALRFGINPKEIIKELKGISCHRPAGFGTDRMLSCADALGKAIENHIKEMGVQLPHPPQQSELVSYTENPDEGSPEIVNLTGACPLCGGPLMHVEGCIKCAALCGYSECS
ncbi:MAG: vitamin B12-dependent ribonucleotide reductase [Nanoarchaeota archaeon]|nr:vitamin B12-dependent ribonucleotide reductase [Nanoarchaeota archaeon]MBU1321419.1 vitamin B12-dependent ribonucleotide reductase [Nanoarchaeota archaeon]MBU1597045.1 vitamin B12-dependent ribonucleotide reductase [Nanoarchaeota archaeon]MBU2440835.1 vitamin B12-dependent ribonucleotide reductase [Nanoarchaeota archaeon]